MHDVKEDMLTPLPITNAPTNINAIEIRRIADAIIRVGLNICVMYKGKMSVWLVGCYGEVRLESGRTYVLELGLWLDIHKRP